MAEPIEPVSETIERLAKELAEAGASKWDVAKIVKELSALELNEKEMKEKAAELLQPLNPEAAKVFASFEKMHVYTSRERLEAFDRGNIIKSLLKETNVGRPIAEKIGAEVEDRLKDLRINFITTSLIREIVDVKLLEYGHEQIHEQYTRLGLPVFEVQKKLEKGFFPGKELMREFSWLKVIPKTAREMHFNREIHIVKPEDFAARLFSYSHLPVFENESIEEAVIKFGGEARRLQKFFSLPLNFHALNFSFAALMKKKTKAEEKRTARLLFAQLNSLHGKKFSQQLMPATGLNLFEPAGKFEKRHELKEGAIELANELAEICAGKKTNFRLAFCLDSVFQLKLLNGKAVEKANVSLLDCSEKELRPLNGCLFAQEGNGVSTAIGLNLPKLLHGAKKKESVFMEKTSEAFGEIKKLFELKEKTMVERSYLKENGIDSSEFLPLLGLHGLFQSCLLIEGDEKSALRLSEKIVSKAKAETVENAAVCAFSPKKGVSEFNELNERLWGEQLPVVNEQEMFLKSGDSFKKNYAAELFAQNLGEAKDFFGKKAKCVALMPGSQ
ncbi:MAG: ATP cone domain-containing protein [Candidatus Diapherotrites archaeon]